MLWGFSCGQKGSHMTGRLQISLGFRDKLGCSKICFQKKNPLFIQARCFFFCCMSCCFIWFRFDVSSLEVSRRNHCTTYRIDGQCGSTQRNAAEKYFRLFYAGKSTQNLLPEDLRQLVRAF